MKVNGNAPTIETRAEFTSEHALGERLMSNMPIRLEIAARILAGWAANTNGVIGSVDVDSALSFADSLIAAHNASSESPATAQGEGE
jgi:hypothetical protein